jgi:hypothetical protein
VEVVDSPGGRRLGRAGDWRRGDPRAGRRRGRGSACGAARRHLVVGTRPSPAPRPGVNGALHRRLTCPIATRPRPGLPGTSGARALFLLATSPPPIAQLVRARRAGHIADATVEPRPVRTGIRFPLQGKQARTLYEILEPLATTPPAPTTSPLSAGTGGCRWTSRGCRSAQPASACRQRTGRAVVMAHSTGGLVLRATAPPRRGERPRRPGGRLRCRGPARSPPSPSSWREGFGVKVEQARRAVGGVHLCRCPAPGRARHLVVATRRA